MYELRAIGDQVSIRFYVLRFSGLGLVVTRLIIEVSQQEFCILSGIATLGFKNLPRCSGFHRSTHRLHSSCFWGLPYRMPNMNPQKALLWSLWVCYSLYAPVAGFVP